MQSCKYLPTRDAADYLGFSYYHFRRIVKTYSIPRKGPHRNRFSVNDLDMWMDDSQCFLGEHGIKYKRNRKIITLH